MSHEGFLILMSCLNECDIEFLFIFCIDVILK